MQLLVYLCQVICLVAVRFFTLELKVPLLIVESGFHSINRPLMIPISLVKNHKPMN